MYILIYGNVVDGHMFVGPFISRETAEAALEQLPAERQPYVARLFAPIQEDRNNEIVSEFE
jgi:hypothetical protein